MLDFYTFSHFKQYPNLLHAVSTKSLTRPYSFSLALHTGEHKSKIIANRLTLAKTLSKPFNSTSKLNFIVANQTHSDHISIITSQSPKGWDSEDDAIVDCDALITNVPHVMLSILTADCVPILLYDPVHEAIAAVHAGWKGTKACIVQKTIEKMKITFDCTPSDIIAGIAPSIGKCCYEVGEDVAKHFYKEVYTKKADKYMLDLPRINKTQLLQFGVLEKNIEMSNICTACEAERFFSYRKEQNCSGRFMSIIGLQK